jgi:hypothetical protein
MIRRICRTIIGRLRGTCCPLHTVKFLTNVAELTTKEKSTYAKQALENPIFDGAVNDIKNEIIGRWMQTNSKQIEERELYYLHLRVVSQFMARLNQYVNDVRITSINLERRGIKEPE